ncbi:MAG: aspartate--tRNA ligase [Rickettsiaceae bacterium]
MHKYRTHNCGQLNISNLGQVVKLSGWVYRRRDHGQLVFIDLRDHYGLTQLVFPDTDHEMVKKAGRTHYESVVTIIGTVVARSEETINPNLSTGKIEILVQEFFVESPSEILPMTISTEQEVPEELRLRYRFLELRKENMHDMLILRAKIIQTLRNQMINADFTEVQTPILGASSPEGARDFLVPSRLHPGKFYALPQAPQQFKQLLMISGVDKYFQIAPCFRDEDARSDRSPGEFYQLDIEMSFVTQEDVLNAIEPILYNVFAEFSDSAISQLPFIRISYDDAMLKYGTDKPDLRNPIVIHDVTKIFKDSNFTLFSNAIRKGSVVRAIPAPRASDRSRRFFDDMIEFAISEGAKGLGYIQFTNESSAKGPIAKFLTETQLQEIQNALNIGNGDSVFFSCGTEKDAAKIAGKVRTKIANELDLIEKDCFKFCWIIDFPFYELNEETGKIDFSHNPFSMPQGGMDALIQADNNQEKLLEIKAFQYDIVCNGIELSSGAIRNHQPELMYKAFQIVGYSREDVDKKFGAMINALKFGAPPHGGIAPGIDRMIMLILGASNIRDIIAFPLNQKAEDLLMNAPSVVDNLQLKELNIKSNAKI